jgi:hypothetical protein
VGCEQVSRKERPQSRREFATFDPGAALKWLESLKALSFKVAFREQFSVGFDLDKKPLAHLHTPGAVAAFQYLLELTLLGALLRGNGKHQAGQCDKCSLIKIDKMRFGVGARLLAPWP